MNRDQTLKQLNALSEVCVQLSAAMLTFGDVVIRENEAIQRSDLKELEGITDEKEVFGDSLRLKIRDLATRMDDFVSSMGLKRISANEERQLSEFVKSVRKCVEEAGNDEFVMQALTVFEAEAENLKSVREKIFAQVERNAYMTTKLLECHQENIKVWEEVARRAEGTYGPKGYKSQNTTGRSILTVRT